MWSYDMDNDVIDHTLYKCFIIRMLCTCYTVICTCDHLANYTYVASIVVRDVRESPTYKGSFIHLDCCAACHITLCLQYN